MKTFLATLISGALLSVLYVPEAESARVGGGRSTGIQRSVTPPPKAAPQQQQAAPAAAGAAAQPAAAGNRWMGPLAGLAAGLGLGWLISQGGFGGALGAAMLAMLAALVIIALVYMYMRRNAAAKSMQRPVQFAGMGAQGTPPTPPSQLPGTDGARQPAFAPQAVTQTNIPAGFDVAGFVRQAKINFLRLQEANDRGDMETIRDVCNEEMSTGLQADLAARGQASQHTEIDGLDAMLLEVVTEGDSHFASVSFSGASRENAGGVPQQFQEIWHLKKPVSGGGWLLAGIQQVS